MLVLYAQKLPASKSQHIYYTQNFEEFKKKFNQKLRGEQNCKTSMEHTNLKKKRKTSMKRAKPHAQLKKLAGI
jgi:hypothetical protein